MTCPHRRRIGDNYGMTCEDCGQVLEGYGYWGQSHTCLHVWAEYEGGKECLYCGAWVGTGEDLTAQEVDELLCDLSNGEPACTLS